MSDETKPLDLPADDETPAEQATLVGEPSGDQTAEPEHHDDESSAEDKPVDEAADAPAEHDVSGPFDAPSPAELADATPPADAEAPEEQPAAPEAESEPAAKDFDFGATEHDEPADEAKDEKLGDETEAPVGAEDDEKADEEAHDAPEQAMPAIEPQPTLEEAAAQNPLSAQVVDESMPAHDAVPAEAAADLAKLRLSNDFQGTQQEDPAPLPAGAPQAGTIEDATGVSGDTVSPQVASGMAEAKPADEALHDALSDEPKPAEGEPEADEGQGEEKDEEEVESDVASDVADVGEQDVDAESDADDEDGDEDCIFGDTQMKHMELVEVIGDGLDGVRASAEAAHKAQMAMLQTPMSVLSLEHKDLMTRMRSVLSEVIHLADAIFHRN